MHPRLLTVALVLSVLGLSACLPAPLQREGPYAFRTTEVLRDGCGLVPTPDALWDGSLLVVGVTARMDYALFDMQLVGKFLGVEQDRFALDGSVANAATFANGRECLLDLVSVHMEGETLSPTSFSGTLRVRYESRDTEACRCEMWASFRADQTP